MNQKQKREVLATLVRAGRKDLAQAVVRHRATAAMKVLKAPPEVAEDDPNLMAFFKPLLASRARMGFDENELNGALDFGSWGDIGFWVGDENIYVWLGNSSPTSGDRGFNYMFKDGKAAAQVVLDLIAVQKKADKLSG